jgi:hypothetical protein
MNVSPRELMMAATQVVFQGARTWQFSAHHAHTLFTTPSGRRAMRSKKTNAPCPSHNPQTATDGWLPEVTGPGTTSLFNVIILGSNGQTGAQQDDRIVTPW